MRPAVRLAPLRAHLWGVLLACTYVLVGTWAFTPELARHSLARDVSVAAVPARAQSTARPSSAEVGGRAPEPDARQARAWRGPDVLPEAATRGQREPAPARVRPDALAAPLPTHARPRNGQPYSANPPPQAV
jgi:hypothetical protein